MYITCGIVLLHVYKESRYARWHTRSQLKIENKNQRKVDNYYCNRQIYWITHKDGTTVKSTIKKPAGISNNSHINVYVHLATWIHNGHFFILGGPGTKTPHRVIGSHDGSLTYIVPLYLHGTFNLHFSKIRYSSTTRSCEQFSVQ